MRGAFLLAAALVALATPGAQAQTRAPHVVFVTGDEEYRSEESMPMLARILKRDYGFRVTVLYSLDEQGFIDPNNLTNLPGLAALDSADLMVMFTRYRALPEAELRHILDYVESGRPVVGFRTATHGLRYPNDSTRTFYNEEWERRLFGQKWIVHHGHFGDGVEPLTDVQIVPWRETHPILRGVKPFQAFSWLYHVEGGEHELYGDSKPLLTGRALKTNQTQNLARYPLVNPVAWTKTYTGSAGKTARVFFTTLGHPYDFRDESMRRLALNGMLWAMGMESRIPAEGARADFVGEYSPTPSGTGKVYRQGVRPPPL